MTALVTGAAGAIGEAIVRRLLSQGHEVIAQDLRAEGLEVFHEGLVLPVAGDLLDVATITALTTAMEDRSIDRVIAAHGVDGSGSLLSTDDAFVDRIMSINADSVVSIFDATLPRLRQAQGRFVIVDSQAGLRAERDNLAYCTSKFALVGWARAMASVLNEEGIALRVFCPGCTATPLLFTAQRRFAVAKGMDPDEFIEQRQSGIPLGRFASVDQTAAVACYLAGPGPRPEIMAATGGEVLF